MPTRHPARKARVFRHHRRGGRPGRVDALARDAGHAGPAAFFAGNGNRIADGLARNRHEVQPPIPEADDDLTLLELWGEAHEFAAAAADHTAAAPVPEQLRRSGS